MFKGKHEIKNCGHVEKCNLTFVWYLEIQDQKKTTAMFRDMLKERRASPETNRGDFLDQISRDMDKETFLSEDFIVQLIFGGLFATFESISAVLALAFKLLSEHPADWEEMIVGKQILSINSHYFPNFLLLMLNIVPFLRLSTKRFSKTEKIQILQSRGTNINP